MPCRRKSVRSTRINRFDLAFLLNCGCLAQDLWVHAFKDSCCEAFKFQRLIRFPLNSLPYKVQEDAKDSDSTALFLVVQHLLGRSFGCQAFCWAQACGFTVLGSRSKVKSPWLSGTCSGEELSCECLKGFLSFLYGDNGFLQPFLSSLWFVGAADRTHASGVQALCVARGAGVG